MSTCVGKHIAGEHMETVNLRIRRFSYDDIKDFAELIRDKMSSTYLNMIFDIQDWDIARYTLMLEAENG